ncbi:MAG: hypothetical protein ACOYMA_16095 [Bacteroidia bacterium]
MIHPFVNGVINNVIGVLKKFDCKIKVSRSEQNQYFSTCLCKYFNQIKLKKERATENVLINKFTMFAGND